MRKQQVVRLLVENYGLNSDYDFSNIHKHVPEALENRGHGGLGKNLTRLKKERKKADYDDYLSGNIQSFTMKNLRLSEKIIEGLS